MHNEPSRSPFDAESDGSGPLQSKPPSFVAAVIRFLDRRSAAPREKSKAADWVMVGLTIAIAFVGIWSAFIFQHQLEDARRATLAQERPWVAFVGSSASHVPVRETTEYKFTRMDGAGKTGKLGLEYILLNSGRTPALVMIWGEIVVMDDRRKPSESAERECQDARNRLDWSDNAITVVPQSPSMYGIHYDGRPSSTASQHRPIIAFDPTYDPAKSYRLANYGCILYKSTIENDEKVRQTPFVVYFTLEGGATKDYLVLTVGAAN